VYCLQVITLLVDICILDYEVVCNCMIIVFHSSLPFACFIVMCVAFPLCNDHQFIDVSRCEKFLWSTGEW